MDKRFSVLFEPIQIGTMKVKNRFVLPPMHTGFATEWGEVTDRLISYFIERARGGVGLLILENTAIDWNYGRAVGNPVAIYDNLFRSGLSDLTLAVHRYGAKIVTQLQHTGRQNLGSNITGGKAPVAPSAIKSKFGGDEPRALEEHEIEEIIQMFVDGARRTKQAGFDGVELHGAHGYLITQFFSPYTNKRVDKWGGSFENRARFPLEVVQRVRQEVGPDFQILYRLSAEERVPGGITLEDTCRLVKLLDEAGGVDCFDVSVAIHESLKWMMTMQGTPPGSAIHYATVIKGVTNKPVIGISRLGFDVEYTAQVVREKKADMVAMGRALFADPHIPNKIFEGRTREICTCIACNECIGMVFNGWKVRCVTNPMLSNEYLDPIKSAITPRKVAVIGGGPAGIQCALVSAQRGHEVTIIEKSSQLGGQLIAGSIPAYKKREWEALLGYYNHMVNKLGIKVKLNTEVRNRLPDNQKADVVVLALGAVPDTHNLAGREHVLDAYEVLLSQGKGVGRNVVVIGGSGVGLDVSLFLMEKKGRRVTLIDMLPQMGVDLNALLQPYLLELAREKGIEFLNNAEVVKLEKGKVHVKTLLGNKTLVCDTIVSAIGFVSRPTEQLKESLGQKGMKVFVVGSAIEAGKIFDATQSGFWTAVEL